MLYQFFRKHREKPHNRSVRTRANGSKFKSGNCRLRSRYHFRIHNKISNSECFIRRSCSSVQIMEVELLSFITSTLHGGEWSASQSSRFIPAKRSPLLLPLNMRLNGPQSRSLRLAEQNNRLIPNSHYSTRVVPKVMSNNFL